MMMLSSFNNFEESNAKKQIKNYNKMLLMCAKSALCENLTNTIK